MLVNKKHKELFGIILLLFIAIIAVLYEICRPYYNSVNRVSNILEEKKKDTKDYHTIGWLKVQGTTLDLPILTINHKDPPVNREHFSWVLNEDDQYHNVMNILGHNIFNLSSSPKLHLEHYQRFEDLLSFVYYDFAKENKYIQLTIDNKNYIYKIFSVGFIPSYEVSLFPTGEYSREQLSKQISWLKDISVYDYDLDVQNDDHIISLVTCTRLFGYNDMSKDFIVSGRLVHSGELISDYKVTKNNQYKEINKILKGDGENEDASST